MKKIFLILASILCCVNSYAQTIMTIAGTGSAHAGGDGGPATAAGLSSPNGGVATDAAGNVYIPDWGNHSVRKIDAATGIISTVAGTGTSGYNGDSILATSAKLYQPQVLALDVAGNIYIGEYSGNRIRKVDVSTGKIYTIMGTGVYGYNGNNIPATSAQCTEITGIAVDAAGNIYFVDMANSIIRKITASTGIVSTIGGMQGMNGFGGDGGPATAAKFQNIFGLAIDASNNIYVCDRGNQRVRKIDANGIVTTVAGNGAGGITGGTLSGDGASATLAGLNDPNSLALDPWGNIYIADEDNDRIRKVDAGGIITTFAGGGPCGSSCGDGGPATSAGILSPGGVFVDPSGAVYVTESGSSVIRKISCFDVSVLTSNDKCPGSCDGTIKVSSSGGVSPYNYSWTGGLGTDTVIGSVCSGTYTVTVIDNTNCKVNGFAVITAPSSINISITNTNASCLHNGSATATVLGGTAPFAFAWSNGYQTSSINGLAAGTYTLVVTDTNNCTASKVDTILNYPAPYASAPICMVTVDLQSQYNMVMWDKTAYTNVDSFIIYRETSTNIYNRIGSVPFNSLSQFVDTARTTYFPNTGNPNEGTFRYKIQTLDTCGTYSLLSPYHNTIYVIDNGNGTFYWTQLYTIENGVNPVSNYVLMRDDLSNGNWQPVTSVAGTQQTVNDPMYAMYQNTAHWRVQTQWSIACTPTARQADGVLSSFNTSVSNACNSTLNSVASNRSTVSLNVSPNPSSGKLLLHYSHLGSQAPSLVILNSIGTKIHSQNDLPPNQAYIDLTGVSPGIYFLTVKTLEGSTTKKIVIQ